MNHISGNGAATLRDYKMETQNFNAFFNAYITAALWSSVDDNDDPLDSNYTAESIEPVTLEKMKADCHKFITENDNLLSQVYKTVDGYSSAGHDFWLTRNGHGAGFWDRGFGYIGDALTDRSTEFKECLLYVGDDNLIYQ